MTGATINKNGSLVIEAGKVGADTVLAQIVAMVSNARRSRAPIQGLADRVSAIFVPTVVAVAMLAFVGWMIFGPEPALVFAIASAVSVLIIACPCALGLATPISITTAAGRGAQAGVLIKDAEALERMAGVDTLIVDKTGTLTMGKPKLTDTVVLGDVAEADLLSLAAALERGSEHPLAEAIVEGAEAQGAARLEATDFEAVTGKGVRGKVGGRAVALGNAAMMQEMGLDTAQRRGQGRHPARRGQDGDVHRGRWGAGGHRGGGRPDQGQHRAGDQGTARPGAARHHGDRRQRTHGAGGGGQARHRRGARGRVARGQEGPDRPVAHAKATRSPWRATG